MIKTQRKVSENLGKNITHQHTEIYDKIEKRLGPTKKCNFGHVRGSKTGVKHEGDPNVPIRDFELKGEDGLQGFCRECSIKRRSRRLEMSREKNTDGYNTYETEYNTKTKCCSQCKQQKKQYKQERQQ